MATPRVFISMGTPYTAEYQKFRDELESFLRDSCHVDPRILGKNEYPSGSPLAHIRSVMRTCSGVMIVAYERRYLQTGIERRGSSGAEQLADRKYTTPWNHIESAMAYSLDLPLYIICQKNLWQEGLIESKEDWQVPHVDVGEPDALSKVKESIRAWIETRVIPRSKRSNILESLSGHVKFSEMTPVELWTFFGVLVAAWLGGAWLGPALPNVREWFEAIERFFSHAG